MLDRAETSQILEVVDVDMPVVDFVASLAQQIGDHVLARPFRAAGRRYRDEIPRGGQLRVEAGVDGIQDLLFDIAGVFACIAIPWILLRETAPIKP